MKNPKITIICPIFNAIEYIEPFINSILRQEYNNFQLIIVDDGSTDGSALLLEKNFHEIKVLKGDGNFWWTKSINMGIKYALENGTDYILTLNVDLIVLPDYLNKLVEFIPDENSIIGSAQYDISDNSLISLGGTRNWIMAKDKKNIFNKGKILYTVSHFCGRGLLIPKAVFKKVGLFDEVNFPQYAADDVFTFKAAQNGFKIYCNSRAKVFIDKANTGITFFKDNPSLLKFFQFLTSRKSSGNLFIRWKMAFTIAPIKNLFPFILVDTARVIGGYFKYLIKFYFRK